MKCNLCARRCNVDRSKTFGFCGLSNKIKVAKVMLYMDEEPCISGINGSGSIFFSGCNMKCIFCQNYEISNGDIGKEVSVLEFCDICLSLQEKGAHNINLVTPGHFAHLIKEGILLAKEKGLKIPIIYNTNGYDSLETIESLDGVVDVYLPDFKYFDDSLAIKYSKAPGYFENVIKVIDEMYRQTGPCVFKDDIMTQGVLVRHLILPTLSSDSKKIINYLYSEYSNNIYLSIMNQYTPVKEFEDDILNKKVSDEEYDDVIDYAYDLGVRNCFVQEEGTCSTSFIPDFSECNF